MKRRAPDGKPTGPVARVVPHAHEAHGDRREDEYRWLRDRDDPAVIAHLEAENAHAEAAMAHLAPLRETLFEEIVGRIKKDDSTVPYRLEGCWYSTRYETGKEYPLFCRRESSLDAPEQVMLDANALAVGESFLSVAGVTPSPGGATLAFAVDTVGRRVYTLRFRDLASGQPLADTIPEVTGNLAWAADGRTLFYTRQDPETLRSFQVWRHVLGSAPADDVLVYQENDERFGVYVWRTKSRGYLMIGSFQTHSSEIRVLPADDPTGEFRVLEPRKPGHEYMADHLGDSFWIRTNDGARNFRLARTPVDRTGREAWQEVVPHREDVLLESFELFRDHLALVERRDGLPRIRIRRLDDGGEHLLEFDEPAYSAWVDVNAELDTPVLRYGYTSLATPDSIYDYDMNTRRRTLMKRDEIVGGFSPDDYGVERLWAPARDGARVPVSLIYRKPFARDGGRPLLLYGYGAYGITIDPGFSGDRLSLLDRGFVFAIAHVRGSETLGRAWYEDGKLLKKMNTFHDFIDCAEYLTAEGHADPSRLYASGGSAGGLLVGVVANMRPELFHGIVARVPFVDVVTTMLDESIPLTTGEYDEWGDPRDETFYRAMLAYSPYDNVKAADYPHLLVTAGLHDSQVQYWEPAKWVARLRARTTDGRLLLLKTNMEAGHGGASGRFRRHRETAMIYAFLLDLAGSPES